jgi:hypothetical protein
MNSFAPAPELPRWGVVTVDGKVIYEGEMLRKTVAFYNAIHPAASLRITSAIVTSEELHVLMVQQMREGFAKLGIKFSSDEEPEPTPPNSPKPRSNHLRVIK